MPRINPVDPEQASGRAKELMDGVQKKMGMLPNIMRTMAQSPHVLEAYLGVAGAMAKFSLPAKLKEQIALLTAELNGCDYCLAAHGALAKSAGLSDQDITDGRRGSSPDGRTEAAMRFTRKIVTENGMVSDADVSALRDAGFSDGQIMELVAVACINIFTNYINHVADTDIDFPAAPRLQPQPM